MKLGILGVLGLCVVSIPVTLALLLTTGGASTVLSAGAAPVRPFASQPTRTAPVAMCHATRGYYALTFEDGPVPGATPRIVRTLRDAGATATFFDVGSRAAAHPELVGLQRGAGQVASHAYTHIPLSELSPGGRVAELQAAARVLGHSNGLFRPPGGPADAMVEADARASGLVPVGWTVDVRDLTSSVRTVVERAASVGPGGILRLHEGSDTAIAALPGIVATLRRHGLCPGTISVSGTSVFGALVVAP